MAIDTYDNLKTEIAAWLDRDDELNDYIDSFIDLAEARHKRDIRLRSQLVREQVSITEGDRYISPPGSLLDLKYFRILVPNSAYYDRLYMPDFTQLSIDELSDRSQIEKDRPRNWAFNEEIELNAPADQDYTGEFFYYQAVTPLSPTSATNVILQNHPDAYLYGSLSAAAPFLMHDERLAIWETLYSNTIDLINQSEIRNQHAGPIQARVQNIPIRPMR